jgi:hypothetical protein
MGCTLATKGAMLFSSFFYRQNDPEERRVIPIAENGDFWTCERR